MLGENRCLLRKVASGRFPPTTAPSRSSPAAPHRAAKAAKLREVSPQVRDADEQALTLAVSANVIRTDLNPLVEARADRRLVDKHGDAAMFFLVCDGLRGPVESVDDIWPRAIVQTCGAPRAQASSLASKADRYELAHDLRVLLAFTGFAKEHWRQLWSTNSLERLNVERWCGRSSVSPTPR